MKTIEEEFQKLTENETDPSAIKGLIGRTEDLYLECKTINEDEIHSNMTTNSQSVVYFNYGKALSAFANAEGGIVVWGLFAKEGDKHSPDLIQEDRPVKQVTKVKTDFDSMTGKVVSRRVVGVQNKIVYTDKANDLGFIVTYIPKSDEAPHRVEGDKKGSRRYYRRHGNGSYEMEHYELEELFGGRTRPKLKVIVRYYIHTRANGLQQCSIDIGLKNIGMSVAKYPLLEIIELGQFSKAGFGIDGNRNTGLPQPKGNSNKYQGGVSDIIHIDDTIWIDKYNTQYDEQKDKVYHMKVKIACDGYKMSFVNIQLDVTDLHKGVPQYIEFDTED